MIMLSDIISIIGFSTMVGGFIYVGRKLQALDRLEETMEKVKANLKVVSDYLTATHKDFNHKELQVYSPLRLTQNGKNLLKEVGFESIFGQYKDDFFSVIDDDAPKLKYDVERSAIRSISVLSDRDYMSFLKVFFYNNPDRSMANTGPTLGVYVRDRYLEEHPEIAK
jgi:hypothetical protein